MRVLSLSPITGSGVGLTPPARRFVDSLTRFIWRWRSSFDHSWKSKYLGLQASIKLTVKTTVARSNTIFLSVGKAFQSSLFNDSLCVCVSINNVISFFASHLFFNVWETNSPWCPIFFWICWNRHENGNESCFFHLDQRPGMIQLRLPWLKRRIQEGFKLYGFELDQMHSITAFQCLALQESGLGVLSTPKNRCCVCLVSQNGMMMQGSNQNFCNYPPWN